MVESSLPPAVCLARQPQFRRRALRWSSCLPNWAFTSRPALSPSPLHLPTLPSAAFCALHTSLDCKRWLLTLVPVSNRKIKQICHDSFCLRISLHFGIFFLSKPILLFPGLLNLHFTVSIQIRKHKSVQRKEIRAFSEMVTVDLVIIQKQK